MNTAICIFVANAVSTFCLIGLIWTIQIVHYPAFHYVSGESFPEFASFHQRSISFVVIPLMLVELGTSFMLVWARPDFYPRWTAVCGLLLVGTIWLSTFAIQVPIHGQLSEDKNALAIQHLVTTNWIRTIAWSGRGLLLAWALLCTLLERSPRP